LKKLLSIALAGVCLCMPVYPAATALVSGAKSAILMDAATGVVLYEQNANAKSFIASTTKIMTGLIVLENAELDDTVNVSPQAVGVEGSSIYLEAGQKISVKELLYGLLLKSGNDAAAALAIHCAGGIDAFAGMMNERARSLSMTGSHFTNPHGLNHPEHYSTARDMAKLTRAALNNSGFSEIVRTKYYKLNGVTIKNHNKMLWNYNGADGVKTGFTKLAGRCLVSSATRGNMQLICVTLKASNDWGDHAALLNYGFDSYTLRHFFNEGQPLATLPVYGGEKNSVEAVVNQDIRLLLKKGQADKVKLEVVLPRYLWAGIARGEQVGILRLTQDNNILLEYPVVAKEAILAVTPKRRLRDLFKKKIS